MIESTNTLTLVNGNTLSESERSELAHCEKVVAAGCKHFMEVGNALLTIQQGKLYRETHTTFENYLRDKWDISRGYGYKSIEAAKTVENLTQMCPIGHILPDNESQTRALSGLSPKLQQQVWQKAVTESDGRPTARVIREVAREYKPTPSLSSKPGDKSMVGVATITRTVIEETQEEGADYRARWKAEKERADQLQVRVRELEADLARLQPSVADVKTEVMEIAPIAGERQASRHTSIPSGKDATCPVCKGPDWSQCACDADEVNRRLREQGRIAA